MVIFYLYYKQFEIVIIYGLIIKNGKLI